MARLEFDITGNVSGLSGAAGQAKGILAGLQKAADSLTIRLFDAKTKEELNAVGGALQTVTGKIKEYTNEAIKGSQAFKDQQIQAALTNLNTKLTVLQGTAQIFGTSLQNNQQQIKAYQTAITDLLKQGVDPLDQKIKNLKSSIDSLTTAPAPPPIVTPATLGAIEGVELRLRELQQTKKRAFGAEEISRLNREIGFATRELARLNSIGGQTSRIIGGTASGVKAATVQYNQFGMALGYIIQDAPYAAYNFGAIGNNITQAAAALPGYRTQILAVLEAQGRAATGANILRQGIIGLTGGFGGALLAISLLTSAYTVYQQLQQKAARATEEQANAIQKQKSALDDYISTLGASQRLQAAAIGQYGEEVSKLDSLFSAVQKNVTARYGNITALEELQRLYPTVFGNLTKETILTDDARKAYDKLRIAIEQTGIAEAAKNLAQGEREKLVKTIVAEAAAGREVTKARKAYNDELAKAQKRDPDIIALSGPTGDALTSAIEKQKDYRKQLAETNSQLAAFSSAQQKAQKLINDNTPAANGIIEKLERELKRLQDVRPTLTVQADIALNTKAIKRVQAELDKYSVKDKTAKGGAVPRGLTLSQQLDDIGKGTNVSAATAGLEGFDKQIAGIEAKYEDLFNSVQQYNQKLIANTKLSEDTRNALLIQSADKVAELQKNKAAEISGAELLEAQRVSDEKTRILNAFGVKVQESKAKDLAALKAQYEAEIIKAKENADLKKTIDEGYAEARIRINNKYLKEEEDLNFKIEQIQATADSVTGKREDEQTARIKIEWAKRKKAAAEYFDTLIALANNDETLSDIEKTLKVAGYLQAQRKLNQTLNTAEVVDIKVTLSKEFNNSVKQGLNNFSRDFISTLSTINERADKSFSSVFSELSVKLSQLFNDVLFSRFTNKLTDGLFSKALDTSVKSNRIDPDDIVDGIQKGAKGLSKSIEGSVSNGIAAGVAFAGGAISGIAPKTNGALQGIGGALSGAASGAVLGTALGGPIIGTAIGAGVGLVGGLVGSKKAREQEKIQQQQLEEQKKQTALLERQQRLSYSSQIVGRMTEKGVITAIDVNEFGELTATIAGSDIKLSYDRETKKQGRGV